MSDLEQLRVPPCSIQSEQALLGALLIAPETIANVRATIERDDFYRRDHQLIYAAICDAHESGRSYDAVTLGDWFSEQGQSELIAGGAYLVELASTTPSAANISAYADIVRQASIKRKLIEIGTEMVNRGFNCATPEEIITEGFAALSSALSRTEARAIEPVDMFTDYATSSLRPELLPPGISEYAYDQARVIGIAPEMVALACIGTIAAAVDDGFKISPKGNEPKWRERACLWFMLIAPPGSKKSAAVKRAMAPLRAIDAELVGQHAAEMREFIPKEREYAIRAKEAAKIAAKGQGFEEPPAPPERPAQRRAIVSDVTTEKLGELLLDNPRGLLWYSDELAVWFATLQGYSKGDAGRGRGMALQAYEGGSYTFDRIGRGSVHVPNWSYSLIGTTQPDKITELISKAPDDGLLQRFIIIDITTRPPLPDHDKPADTRIERQYEESLRNVWNTKPGEDGTVVSLSEEAKADWRAFSDFVNRTTGAEGLPSMLRGHLSKWEGMWPRLVLTYHAWGCALAGKHPGSTPVSGRTTKRVTAFMREFMLPQALRFYGSIAGSGDSVYGLAQKVAGTILAEKMCKFTSRDLHRSMNAWRVSSEQSRKAAVQLLRECGWIIGSESSSRLGSDGALIVAPQVHKMFAQRAAEERARRASAATSLGELRRAAQDRREG